MDDLIRLVAQKLGLEEAVVKKSLGAILTFVKEHAKDIDFNKIISDLGSTAEALMQDKDAENAVRQAGAETSSGSGSGGPKGIFGLIFSVLKALGVLEILKNILKPFFGESAVKLIESVEDGAELAMVLEKLGISREQGVQMVQMLVDFLKEKVSPETVQKITQQVPAIQIFLGEAKKDD